MIPSIEKRICGTCTRCCEGWLRADVRGHAMSPGTPCFFLRQGKCSDYENRPQDPCRVYTCAWLDDMAFPDWLKPSLANIIISRKTPANINLTYYEVVECGGKIDSVALNWIIRWAIGTGTNLMYSVDGKAFTLGSREFGEFTATL